VQLKTPHTLLIKKNSCIFKLLGMTLSFIGRLWNLIQIYFLPGTFINDETPSMITFFDYPGKRFVTLFMHLDICTDPKIPWPQRQWRHLLKPLLIKHFSDRKHIWKNYLTCVIWYNLNCIFILGQLELDKLCRLCLRI